MKKFLVVAAAVLLTCSLATAGVNNVGESVRGDSAVGQVRTNGTLGNFTASITQTGALQVDYGATVTTAGGDGQPLTFTYGTSVWYLHDQVRVAAQLYDSPWSAHTWTTFNGMYFDNSPTALGSFTASFSATVPRAANYQVWAAAIAGHTWPLTSFNWFDITQGVSGNYYTHTAGPMATTYVDSTVPPTPTYNPNAGGNPIPTLNWLGMLAMVAMLLGVAVLVIIRRR